MRCHLPPLLVLMPTRDHVTGPAQVFRQVRFHLGSGFMRHRVQALIKLWQ